MTLSPAISYSCQTKGISTLLQCIILCTVLLCGTGVVRGSEFLCRQLSINEGLSQSNVLSIVRDKKGFLWIGTRFGLNRYDFAKVDNYYHDSDDPNSIPDNIIEKLYVDSRGVLWVAGQEGLVIHDPITNSFINMTVEGASPTACSFLQEPNGLLIGTTDGLLRYDYSSGLLSRIPATGCPRSPITAIHHWQPEAYLLMTRWDGMWLYDRTRGTCSPMPGFDEQFLMTSYLDSHGRLWVSDYGAGVFCYGHDGTRSHVLNTSNSHLSSDIVLDIVEINGELWFATDGGGVSVYNPTTREFTDTDPRSVLRNMGSVTALYVDDFSNIFAGTVRDGAMTVRNVAIQTFQSGADHSTRLGAVSGFQTDADGTVWIADDGHGIYRHKEGTHDFSLVPSTANMKVIDIASYDHSTLIFSTFEKGLFLLDKKSGRVSAVPKVLSDFYTSKVRKGLAMHLRNLPDGRIAFVYDEICTYRPGASEVKRFPKSEKEEIAPFYNEKGMILCRGHNFISSFNSLNDSYRILYTTDSRIVCATFDGDSLVYIATDKGIETLNLNSRTTRSLDCPVTGRVSTLLLEDRRLWIGAGTQLYLKDIDSDGLTAFGRADGVGANEYLPYSTLITDKYVYLGGVNGLLRIDRREVAGHYSGEGPSDINISEVIVDGVPVFNSVKDSHLDIASGSSSVRLSIVGNGGNALRPRLYRFIISGGGTDKVIETYDHFVNINLLQPGTNYDISATASLPSGVWPTPQKLLSIAVMAPWYRSGWVMAAFCIIIIGIAVYIEWMRRQRNARKMTKQLDDYRKAALENEVAFLTNTNYALRTPLTLIYAPLKVLMERLRNGEKVEIMPELEGIYTNTKKMRDAIDLALEPHPDGVAVEERIQDSEVQGQAAATAISTLSEVDTSDLTAVVAEEDKDLCAFIVSQLGRYFRKVLHTSNGKDALLLIRQNQPDIVITSVKLPGKSGLELCHDLKTNPETNHLPVILLTSVKEALESGYEAGVDSYLSKPFDINVLMSRCRNLLRTRSLIRAHYSPADSAHTTKRNLPNADETFLLKIDKLIAENIHRPDFGVDILTELMNTSRTALYTKFKSITGSTIGSYITEVRLRRSKEMLRDSDASVSEIADSLGFSSQRYFSSFFKERTGMSPSAFRNQE